jgi:uncharacterized protein (DUF362 family)/Pyruvate/2-oxoacid:ferredoxin oxidoreductase delta subunit
MSAFPRGAQRHLVAAVSAGADVAASAARAIALAGGMASVLGGRKVALLKPNFVAGRPARTGATTNLELVAAVAAEVHAAGATPVLCEFPGTEFDVDATFKILGLEEFTRRHEIGFVRRIERWLEVRPPGAKRLKRFRIPAQLEEAALINLPVLKTHVITGMSVAIKNLMGILPLADRRAMHAFGIHTSLADIAAGLHPDLNLVDGTIGQDGDGPLYGHAAHLGVLVAGRDALSVDVACCRLVGVDPRAIPHLREALARLGAREPQLVGDAAVFPPRPFALPGVHRVYRAAFRAMFLLDYPLGGVLRKPVATVIYKTGLIGTRPRIEATRCTRCGDCVTACPIPNVIDLTTPSIDPKTCERCLLCYDACKEGAISVVGMSGAAKAPA